jgi:hypothetical protein
MAALSDEPTTMYFVLSTDQKGAIAESEIAAAAIRLGVGVYRPMFEGGRYDLILEAGPTLLRVQCKWAPRRGDVVIVRSYSCRRTRDGLRKRGYTRAEVDVIAAYCPDLERSFLISSERFDGHPELHLRVAASRNNQRTGINWADDFAFEAKLRSFLGP